MNHWSPICFSARIIFLLLCLSEPVGNYLIRRMRDRVPRRFTADLQTCVLGEGAPPFRPKKSNSPNLRGLAAGEPPRLPPDDGIRYGLPSSNHQTLVYGGRAERSGLPQRPPPSLLGNDESGIRQKTPAAQTDPRVDPAGRLHGRVHHCAGALHGQGADRAACRRGRQRLQLQLHRRGRGCLAADLERHRKERSD